MAKAERVWRRCARTAMRLGPAGAATCALALPAGAGAPKTPPPVPEIRLPFGALGVPGLSTAFLNVGASMFTVHFVDSQHLLVTFGSRGLVHRTPRSEAVERDAKPLPANVEDQERLVTAELVQLPDGKILSRTEWHVHDHARYLWSLGNGRFLLRDRQSLSTFAPLANLQSKEPWGRVAFPHRPGELLAVQVSQDSKLLTIQTAPRRPDEVVPDPAAHTVNIAANGDLMDPKDKYVALDFYRLSGQGTPESPLELVHAGSVRSPDTVRLPMDADGYLHTQDGGRKGWLLTFEGFGGATLPLEPVGSSCAPVLQLVSSGQFVALNCRGTTGNITLAAYDFARHETWEEPIGQLTTPPVFAFAPEAGRFAISRLLASTDPNLPIGSEPSLISQELRIYQTQSGDLLLKVGCSPAFRTAENFDMAADGTRVVIVQGGEVQVYKLPALSKGDLLDLEDVRHALPPESHAAVNLRKLLSDQAHGPPLEHVEPEAPAGAVAGVTTPAGEANAPQEGDVQTRRARPSLLNPGEKPEFKDKGAPPE